MKNKVIGYSILAVIGVSVVSFGVYEGGWIVVLQTILSVIGVLMLAGLIMYAIELISNRE